ncbi:hypothetical protein WME99_40255 [Sorangium sp. So ce136]
MALNDVGESGVPSATPQLMGLETNSIGNRKRDSGPLSGLV